MCIQPEVLKSIFTSFKVFFPFHLEPLFYLSLRQFLKTLKQKRLFIPITFLQTPSHFFPTIFIINNLKLLLIIILCKW